MQGFKFTDTELNALLKSLVVLVDTREKLNGHILQGIEEQGLKWRSRALKSGDYSVMLPANSSLGIVRDIWLDRHILIERKNSLEEISGNLTQGRERFENEMLRAKNAEKHLLIEGGSWEKVINGGYITGLKPKAFYRSLLSLSNKYEVKIHFIPKCLAAKHIVNILGIYTKNYLEC